MEAVKEVTRLGILRSRLEMVMHNLRCCSETQLMDKPKAGCETDWAEMVQEMTVLVDWLGEIQGWGDEQNETW